MSSPASPTAPAASETPSRWLSRRRMKWLVGGFLTLMFVLAIPLLLVQHFAGSARDDLTAAQEAFVSGDFPRAQDHVESARRDVTIARIATEGPSGLVWGLVPGVGGTVQDVGHLVSALDDATAVAETGVDLYPRVAGDDATLFRDSTVDLDTLDDLLAGIEESGSHLDDAAASLDRIEGDLPGIGSQVLAARDAARARIDPLADTYADLAPLFARLPALLGTSEGDKKYLIAVLNPAELRYSGGAALALAPMTFTDGTLEIEDSIDLDSYRGINDPLDWERVAGNQFTGISFKSSTLAPSWNVAGEELLRAWRALSGERYDGVIAVDAVALSRLFALTGPLDVPGYPTLTGDNLVQTLVGSYDLYSDPEQRDALNAAVIKAFRGKLLDGGELAEKLTIVHQAADGGHLAIYVRDQEARGGITELGLSGDLPEVPSGDYLGVFTQNFNQSKMDFFQRRFVTSEVRLDTDGTARVRLRVKVENVSPPYEQDGEDPGIGYFTRDLGITLATFLPAEATDLEAVWQGEALPSRLRSFQGHQYFTATETLSSGREAVLEATYTVPGAATVAADGSVSYEITLDPQGMATPQSSDLTVRFPPGFSPTSLPDGWIAVDGGARIDIPGLDSTPTWTLEASP